MGFDPSASAESGSGIEFFSSYFDPVRDIEKYKPDFVVVLGDRSELFSVGVPSMIYNIPIIHIYGGDVTQGCTDESTRHSISMLSNYHFVSNYKSFKNTS